VERGVRFRYALDWPTALGQQEGRGAEGQKGRGAEGMQASVCVLSIQSNVSYISGHGHTEAPWPTQTHAQLALTL